MAIIRQEQEEAVIINSYMKHTVSCSNMSNLTALTVSTTSSSSLASDDASTFDNNDIFLTSSNSNSKHRRLDASDVTFWKHPRLTLEYFVKALWGMVPKQWPWTLRATILVSTTSSIAFGLHYLGKSGQWGGNDLQRTCVWLETIIKETTFWIVCGILSSIGLGSGVQTGALFLFPHVCRLAIKFAKDDQSDSSASLAWLLWSVAIPGFWSGTGSAIGELVPFVLARIIKKAGGDPFAILMPNNTDTPRQIITTENNKEDEDSDIDDDDDLGDECDDVNVELPSSSEEEESSIISSISKTSTPQLLLANSRRAMESQLSTNAFWKVFALAVIPNALFDLAGLVSGASSDMSMMTFFMATWTAKALVRTPLQTCGLALAVIAIVNPDLLPMLQSSEQQQQPQSLSKAALAMGSSSSAGVQKLLETWGRKALSQFVGDDDEELGGFQQQNSASAAADDGDSNTIMTMFFGSIKVIWTILTVAMFGYFIVTTIEQIAQHHIRTQQTLRRESNNTETKNALKLKKEQ